MRAGRKALWARCEMSEVEDEILQCRTQQDRADRVYRVFDLARVFRSDDALWRSRVQLLG